MFFLNKPTTLRSRLSEIDALRGIAALLVVLFHLTSRYDTIYGHTSAPVISLSWGHYGVNLFFMISGFVIFMSLDRTRTALDFVVSRLSRLFPTYWAAIIITTLVVAILGLPDRELSLRDTLANFSMIHNLFGVAHVDGVYWTLEIEMIFYCWALIAFSVGWLSKVHLLVAILLSTRLVDFWCQRYFQFEFPALISHLLILKQIAWFGAGIMIYRIVTGSATRRKDLVLLLGAIALTTIVEGYRLGAIMLVCATVLYSAAVGRLPLNRPWLIWLGTVSYPWYLIHQNVGYAFIRHFGSMNLPSNIAIGLAGLISITLAYLLLVFVDRPAIKWLRHQYIQTKQLVLDRYFKAI
jgi:peptidoglycan/LPS O-acetylase OafA/YrhL